MIQRIQSIYLLVAATLILAMYGFPWVSFGGYNVFVCHIQIPQNGVPLFSMVPFTLLTVLSVGLSLFSIFKFKNRLVQLKLNKYNLALLIAILSMEVIYFYRIGNILMVEGKPGFSAIFPLVSFMFIILANRAIKKDEKLVRSVDRIR